MEDFAREDEVAVVEHRRHEDTPRPERVCVREARRHRELAGIHRARVREEIGRVAAVVRHRRLPPRREHARVHAPRFPPLRPLRPVAPPVPAREPRAQRRVTEKRAPGAEPSRPPAAEAL